MKVSVNVYTQDIDAATSAFRIAVENKALNVTLSTSHDWQTEKFEFFNLCFDASHESPAVSNLDDGPFRTDSNFDG